MGERQLFGDTKNIEVEPEFYLGGIPQAMREADVVLKNLVRACKSRMNFHLVTKYTWKYY